MRKVACRNIPHTRARAGKSKSQLRSRRRLRTHRAARPPAAYRQRGANEKSHAGTFSAPETWHPPTERDQVHFVVEPPGTGYVHPVSVEDVRERIAELPPQLCKSLEVVQFSRMTRKRALFPCYGMQWGPAVYLYPIEESYEEAYLRPPTPQQKVDAQMYGGTWRQTGQFWVLQWTPETIRDFYLNNVLIHEIGHIHDQRNTNAKDRERYADWCAIEYGYRASRKRW